MFLYKFFNKCNVALVFAEHEFSPWNPSTCSSDSNICLLRLILWSKCLLLSWLVPSFRYPFINAYNSAPRLLGLQGLTKFLPGCITSVFCQLNNLNSCSQPIGIETVDPYRHLVQSAEAINCTSSPGPIFLFFYYFFQNTNVPMHNKIYWIYYLQFKGNL